MSGFGTDNLDSGSRTDHDTLESYILNTSRKVERAARENRGDDADTVPVNIYLEKWQTLLVKSISDELNTSISNVVNRAYRLGLENIREDVDGWIRQGKLRVSFTSLIDQETESEHFFHMFRNRYTNIDCGVKTESDDSKEEDGTSVRVFRSIVSEVQDRKQKLEIEGSLHRVVVAFGLKCSRLLGNGRSRDYCMQIVNNTKEKVPEFTKQVESLLRDYLKARKEDWKTKGISQTAYDTLQELYDIVRTESGEEAKKMIEEINEEHIVEQSDK